MENLNEEKSLVKVDNSIFARMRRFFHRLFSKRKNADDIEIYDYESQKKVSVEKEEVKRNIYTDPKLFNYDNPQYQYDSTLGKKPILNNNENNEDSNLAQLTLDDSGISKYFDDDDLTTKSQEFPENNNENENKDDYEKEYYTQSTAKYEDDGYECKEELEKKLMNYYASIKKVIQ